MADVPAGEWRDSAYYRRDERLGNGADRAAKHHLERLGVEVLLKNLQLASGPGVSHHLGKRCNHIGHEPSQPHPQNPLTESPAQILHLMGPNELHELFQVRRLGGELRRLAAGQPVSQGGQFAIGQANDLAGSVPGIHEPPNGPQAVHLLKRINPLAVLIPLRRGKPIAALPHPKRVLGQTRVALNSRNTQVDGFRNSLIHGSSTKTLFVVDKCLTERFVRAYYRYR